MNNWSVNGFFCHKTSFDFWCFYGDNCWFWSAASFKPNDNKKEYPSKVFKQFFDNWRKRVYLYHIKNNLDFDQIIWEFGTDENPDWVHVSYESSGKQRKQVLKAYKEAGKTKYKPY